MQVNAVLVDELAIDSPSSSPVARPVLYTFESPSLVSARRLETQDRIGPIGLLEEGPAPGVKPFPERTLWWVGRRGDAFSYKEPWTAPPWTLYVLVPPAEFLASSLAVHGPQGAASHATDAASFDDRLFYFSLLGHASDQHGFQVEARFEHDPQAVKRMLSAVETVAGRRKWSAFRESVAAPLKASAAVIGSAAAIRALFGF